jgi:hypothetical protein
MPDKIPLPSLSSLSGAEGAEERLRKLGIPPTSPFDPREPPELRLGDVLPAPKQNPQADEEVIVQKVILALARWARNKMGKRYKDYMRQAEEAYLLEIAEKTNPHDMAFWLNVRRAALEAQIKFPLTLRRRSRRKLFDLTKTLFEEYDQLLPTVQQVKKIENWTVRKLKMAELFKDSTKERIENWCSKSMKPSEVVYEALTIRYSLDIHPDNLKKYLRLEKNRGKHIYHFADIASFLERTFLANPK